MSKYKKNKAVALRYNVDEDTSPVVIASGYGTVAEHIIDIAEKKGIPVFKDDSAASLLCMLDGGQANDTGWSCTGRWFVSHLLQSSIETSGPEYGEWKKAVQNPHLPDIKRKPASPAACAGTWYPDTARMTVNRQYDNRGCGRWLICWTGM